MGIRLSSFLQKIETLLSLNIGSLANWKEKLFQLRTIKYKLGKIMDLQDTPEQANLKTCREWLEKNAKLKTGVEKNNLQILIFYKLLRTGRRNMMLVGPCYISQRWWYWCLCY